MAISLVVYQTRRRCVATASKASTTWPAPFAARSGAGLAGGPNARPDPAATPAAPHRSVVSASFATNLELPPASLAAAPVSRGPPRVY